MTGETNRVVWISVLQVVDLVKLTLAVVVGIGGDTVVDRHWNIPILEERHHVIDIF